MPLPFYRIVCGTCERVISDGWPADAPAEQRVITKHTCRACEEEARLVALEDQRHGVGA